MWHLAISPVCITFSVICNTMPLNFWIEDTSSPHLFQVNYSPYFFDLHLKCEINDCNARVVMANNKITFHLMKLEPTLWETLVNPLAKDSAKRFVNGLNRIFCSIVLWNWNTFLITLKINFTTWISFKDKINYLINLADIKLP